MIIPLRSSKLELRGIDFLGDTVGELVTSSEFLRDDAYYTILIGHTCFD